MKTPRFWYDSSSTKSIKNHLLLPLSFLYQWFFCLDQKTKAKKRRRLPKPVIVVGNINIGGTGKTPVTLALINELTTYGFEVGVLSRGYGRKKNGQKKDEANTKVIIANETHNAQELGDEPYLLYQKTGVPLAVSNNRYKGGMALLREYPTIDLFILDDGLQHHLLERDIEIGVVGRKLFGNERLLPAGPLREPIARLQSVDLIVNNSQNPLSSYNFTPPIFQLKNRIPFAVNLLTNEERPLKSWANHDITAIAGIAHPEIFFSMLKKRGLNVTSYPFSDHHLFKKEELSNLKQPIFMTEKDAVKCEEFALENCWKVPLISELPYEFIEALLKKLAIEPK